MVGSIYSLVGIGFIIIYKATRVINFSQGQLIAIGAMVLWAFATVWKLPLLLSIMLTVVLMALLGAAIEYLFLRRMIGQPIMSLIILTIGLSVLLDNLIYPIFGATERACPRIFPSPSGGLHFFGFNIYYGYLFSFGIALVMMAIFLYFFHTRTGILMRAVADGQDIARSCGVKVGHIFRLVWIISAISAMIGGVLSGSVKALPLTP